jgi:uncharacterized membrane protein
MVRFGILHLIGIGIIISTLITPFPTHSLLLAVALIYLSPLIQSITLNTNLLYPLGFNSLAYNTLDYFPIFPWLSVILIGIFVGRHLYFGSKRQFKIPASVSNTFIGLSGKWSLIIYLVHVPLLAGLVIFLFFDFF